MSDAAARIERLNAALGEAARELEAAAARMQKSQKMRMYVSRQSRVFVSSTEFDAAAASVAGAGGIPEGLLEFLRSGGLKPFSDPDEIAMADEYDDARRTVDLLTGAIAVLKKEIALPAERTAAGSVGDRIRAVRNFFRRDKT